MLFKSFTARTLSFVLVVFIILSIQPIYATSIWSDATYTEQWSEAEYSEQWSVTPTPSTPTAPLTPTAPSAPKPLYIKLQLNNDQATINNKNELLATPPISIDGHTMVPFRFLGNAIDAQVDWDNATQTVTLTLQNKVVKLVIGERIATVNNKTVNLPTQAVVKNNATLVPLRFVLENLDLFVNYTTSTKVIEISNTAFTSNNSQPPSEQPSEQLPIKEEIDQAFDVTQLYGTWYIWTAGTVTEWYDTTTGNYATHDFTSGAEQGKIVINKDGTYSMSHQAWAKNKTVTGKWRLTESNEMTVDHKTGIVLLNGLTDINWNINVADNGKIQLRYAMDWEDGTVTWIHDSELYKP